MSGNQRLPAGDRLNGRAGEEHLARPHAVGFHADSRSLFAPALLAAHGKVYTSNTSIGQIEDILVTIDHATVTAVILSVGGFLGIGDELVAVPVKQIRVGPEARFITDLTKEQLANAPAFDFAKLR